MQDSQRVRTKPRKAGPNQILGPEWKNASQREGKPARIADNARLLAWDKPEEEVTISACGTPPHLDGFPHCFQFSSEVHNRRLRMTATALEYTAIEYNSLNIEVHGPEAGPPLLILHGWGSNAKNMRVIAQSLSDTYRVYNVDLPGHGASPPPPEPWGVPEHAAVLRAFIEDHIGTEVTIIGHSNGGRIALYMASTPELASFVKRLVLVSPSGVTPQRTWRYHARKGFAQALKKPFEVLPAPAREPALDWLRHSLVWKALGSSDYNALQGVMRETFVRTVTHHLDGPVHRIDAPTLLFWGTEDEAISRYQIEFLEDAIADAGLVVLEGAGHYGYLDDFDTFISATRYFLEHS